MSMDVVNKIQECFRLRLHKQISDTRLELCLEDYGKQILGKKVDVKVAKLKYPDIYNNVNIGFKNGKLVFDSMGIYIDSDIIDKYSEDELTAAFLYELGIYEDIQRNPDLKYWIMLGYSSPMLSHFIAIIFVIISRFRKQLNVTNKKQILTLLATYILIIFIGILAGLIGRYKSTRITNTSSFKYVIKYGYQNAYKSFIKKHNEPVELYLYGGEKKLPWTSFIRQLASDLKKLGNIIAYGTSDKATGKICKLNKYEYELLRKYASDNYDYLEKIKKELDEYCKTNILQVGKELASSSLITAFKSIYELLVNMFGGNV